MSRLDPRHRSLGVGMAAAALLLAAFAVTTRPEPGSRAAGAFPAQVELDTLARYTGPVPPAVAFDDYDAYLPAELPPPDAEPAYPVAPLAELDGDRLRLSAILIAGGRPLAIINDRQVRTGERLDGAEVVTIERDRVVLRYGDGSRRTLRLDEAFERTL